MCKIKPMNQVSNYTKIIKYTKFKITLTNKNLLHSCSQVDCWSFSWVVAFILYGPCIFSLSEKFKYFIRANAIKWNFLWNLHNTPQATTTNSLLIKVYGCEYLYPSMRCRLSECLFEIIYVKMSGFGNQYLIFEHPYWHYPFTT